METNTDSGDGDNPANSTTGALVVLFVLFFKRGPLEVFNKFVTIFVFNVLVIWLQGLQDLAPLVGIKHTPLALEGKVLTADHQGVDFLKPGLGAAVLAARKSQSMCDERKCKRKVRRGEPWEGSLALTSAALLWLHLVCRGCFRAHQHSQPSICQKSQQLFKESVAHLSME